MPAAHALLIAAALTCLAALPARAQFELPRPPQGAASAAPGAPMALPAAAQRLSFQYNYGAEITATYKRDPDLDPRLRDNIQLFKPKLVGTVVYRPTDWLATTLELATKREWALREEPVVTLPSGDLKFAPARYPSLRVEQALLTARQAPFEFNIGRRNYEDERHFLFDGSLDVIALNYRHENWRAEWMIGRDILWGLDALQSIDLQPIEMALFQLEYRGFEDKVVIGYVLKRNDRNGNEGRPLLFGLRTNGRPTPVWTYWADFALMRGHDEAAQPLRAHAFDGGVSYRFAELPYDPNITLAYAHGSGDRTPDDGINQAFRQTGLQTNEARYLGVAKFRPYGEALNTELSNLHIATLGLGARAAPGVTIDLVFHRYRLDAPAGTIRNWGFTAQMNTLPGQQSRDVGKAVDLVLGFRGMFGIRRLGLNLRIGRFYPGAAFDTADDAGMPRRAGPGMSIVAKLLY